MNRLIVSTSRLVLIVVMTQLAACSTAPRHWERDTANDIDHSLQQAGAHVKAHCVGTDARASSHFRDFH